jgi:hypothetical protein
MAHGSQARKLDPEQDRLVLLQFARGKGEITLLEILLHCVSRAASVPVVRSRPTVSPKIVISKIVAP